MYCFIVAKRKIFSLNASGIALSMIVSTKRWVGGVDEEGFAKMAMPETCAVMHAIWIIFLLGGMQWL